MIKSCINILGCSVWWPQDLYVSSICPKRLLSFFRIGKMWVVVFIYKATWGIKRLAWKDLQASNGKNQNKQTWKILLKEAYERVGRIDCFLSLFFFFSLGYMYLLFLRVVLLHVQQWSCVQFFVKRLAQLSCSITFVAHYHSISILCLWCSLLIFILLFVNTSALQKKKSFNKSYYHVIGPQRSMSHKSLHKMHRYYWTERLFKPKVWVKEYWNQEVKSLIHANSLT